MQADHFDQQKLLALAAEDVALAQLSHRRRTTLADPAVRGETEVRDLDREQKRLEADVDAVRARAARDQQRLDAGAATPKEMTSLQQEMASLARRQGDLEDQVLELMERRETADAALTEVQTGLASAEQDRAGAEERRDAALADVDEAEQAHRCTRSEITATVPAPLLALYDRIAAQTGSTGAAMLQARRCEGCRIELYGTELSAARNADPHTVLRCENCNRILVRTGESGL